MNDCPAVDCKRQVEKWPPLCVDHWWRLPPAIRSTLRRLYREGAPDQQPAFAAARFQAVAWLKDDDEHRAKHSDYHRALTARICGDRE